MAESPPLPQFSCGTKHPAYLNQAHPDVEDGIVPREVCIKEDEETDIYQACFQVENIRVKNCGDYYSYQLNPSVQDMAYCVYSEYLTRGRLSCCLDLLSLGGWEIFYTFYEFMRN